MNSRPIKFRILVLIVYMTAGALLNSAYIAFIDSMPPNRDLIGEAAFRRAWTLIPLTGACCGAMAYTFPVLFGTLNARQFSLRGLLIGTTLVALALGFAVYIARH